MDEEVSGQLVDGTPAGIKIGNRHPEILRISKKSLMSSNRLATGKSPHAEISNAANGLLE
jgi:hypothetical protein